MSVRFNWFLACKLLYGGFLFTILVSTIACNRSHSARIESVAISADGSLLAIEYGHDNTAFLYKIDVESGNASQLTKATVGRESGSDFSPDGRKIAYTYSAENGQPSSIIIQNLDGSDIHSWPSAGGSNYWPVFAPDGKTIIFARSDYYGNYSPTAQPHAHGWDVYAGDFDAAHVRQLTHEEFYTVSPPSVSADGKNLILVTEQDRGSQQIAIYSFAEMKKLPVSLQPHVPGEPARGPNFAFPNFMPDGKSILFMAASRGQGVYDYDVYRVNIDGGSVERLTQGNGFATALRVSADGRTAVFLKWRLNWQHVPIQSTPYLLDIKTHRLTMLKVKGLPK